MIKFEKTEVVGWEAAIRGMRNPMNSWDKSDSYFGGVNEPVSYAKGGPIEISNGITKFSIGPNDLELMKKLRNAGTDHRKYLRMIVVYVDITAPLYWWKEFDTYKVGTVANSCSTMHKIQAKEFTLDDFSHEHLFDCGERSEFFKDYLLDMIDGLNQARLLYLKTKDKKYWWQMIQLLPSSYNQKRTVMMSYEVLANIYKSRKNHKLDEWKATNFTDDYYETLYDYQSTSFCDWIKTLPYSELITGPDIDILTLNL